MRVTFFNRSYAPDTGATGQLLTELAEDLVAHHGWDVTVVTGRPLLGHTSVPARETRNGVTVIRAAGTAFNPRRFVARAANYLTYFLSACLVARRLPAQHVVVAMTDPPIIGLAALLVRGGARFVFYCQDIFPEVASLLEDFRSPMVDRLLDRLNRFIVRRADRIVALGETMRQRLVEEKGADPARLVIVHNWADADAITPAPKRNPFSEAQGLVDRFVVLHAGNIGLAQNLEVVLDAAERLSTRDDILFLFIGDGSRRARLEAAAQDRGLSNVRFLSFQPRESLRWTYASADVCLVSLAPGLAGYIVPSKIYPVLAAGRPSIAAVERETELAGLLDARACGLQVPPGDGEALAGAVARLAGDGVLRRALGERARAAAMSFTRPGQVAAFAGVLAGVAANQTASAAARVPDTRGC
ncbi:MAG: glycosyltransferase family 4 protein [Vicinamibacterales bacterium]